MAEYNGWTNYETWNVALWLGNELSSYHHWRYQAEACWAAAEDDDRTFTRLEIAVRDLADQLEKEVKEAAPIQDASMYCDLLTAALSEVNWHEIASHYIDEVKEETEEETEIE